MTINVRESAEPLSLASRHGEQPGIIESAAYHQLVHDLRRYCEGEVNGRSFLIAGHRGSGKTTLVSNAFSVLLAEANHGELLTRPLYVSVLGPSLLPDATSALPVIREGKDDKPSRSLTPDENILVQLILALHRAATTEIVHGYQSRINMLARTPPWVDRPSDDAIAGLAAQLELELDGFPGRPRLREFWERAHALRDGVLRDFWMSDRFMAPSPRAKPVPDMDQQGARELVALSSLCEAYRRISGTLTRKDEFKAGEKDKAQRTHEVNPKGADLGGPLMALLGGGTVAAGAGAAGAQPTWAAFSGFLTALLGVASTKYVRTREREHSQASEDLFIPDLSVSSLDRLLPLLLRRLMNAGLAPVFVIDELDKVQGLSHRIPSIVRRLKKVVAENAYFCFLTDRLYFEQMRERDRETPYSIEYTYFTSQLFVTLTHVDLHQFLDRILEVSDPGPSASDEQLRVAENETQDRIVWPYYLLHAAQMHPIDLRRQLDWFRGASSSMALRPGDVRSRPEYRLPVMVQVALELVLGDQDVTLELSRDPPFRRFLHDALYFISREWEKDTLHLDLGDGQRDGFKEYLLRRQSPPAYDDVGGPSEAPPLRDSDRPTGPVAAAANAPLGSKAGGAAVSPAKCVSPSRPRSSTAPAIAIDGTGNLSDEQMQFLWERVRELASLLAKPKTVQAVARERGFPSVIIELLDTVEPLLTPTSPGSLRYEWGFFRACHPRSGAAHGHAKRDSAPPAPESNGTDERDFIQRYSDALAAFTGVSEPIGWLASGLGIIARTPAWPAVLDAMTRLKNRVGVAYTERSADLVMVKQYQALLQRSALSIARALFAGRLVRASGLSESDRLQKAMAAVSEALELLHVEEAEAAALIEKFTRSTFPTYLEQPDWKQKGVVESWSKSVFLAIVQTADAARAKLDEQLLARVAFDYFRGALLGAEQLPDYSVVAAALTNAGPFEVLRFRTENVSIREWSQALYLSLVREDWPLWLAVAAVANLGFDAVKTAIQEKIRVDAPLPLIGPPKRQVDAEWKEIVERLPFTDVAPLPALLISRSTIPAEQWETDGKIALLFLRDSEVGKLSSRGVDLAAGLELEFVLIDATAPEDPDESFDRRLYNRGRGPRTAMLEYAARAKGQGVTVVHLERRADIKARDALEWDAPMPDSAAGLSETLMDVRAAARRLSGSAEL
jgi:hypothetical protein